MRGSPGLTVRQVRTVLRRLELMREHYRKLIEQAMHEPSHSHPVSRQMTVDDSCFRQGSVGIMLAIATGVTDRVGNLNDLLDGVAG